jgi:hypothetical protein
MFGDEAKRAVEIVPDAFAYSVKPVDGADFDAYSSRTFVGRHLLVPRRSEGEISRASDRLSHPSDASARG